MWLCPSEGKYPAPPSRTQASVPQPGNLHKPLDQLHPLGADTKSKRNYNPTACKNGDSKHSKSDKIRRDRTMSQMKEQSKNPQDQIKEEEIGNLPEKEFRVIVVNMTQNLGNRMEKI